MSGGGSKKKQKQQYTAYYLSEHIGVATTLDAVTGIYCGEKQFWIGYRTENGTEFVSNPGLFGGQKKEGGVQGYIEFMLGGAGQVVSETFAAKLGRSVANSPGFRGFTSLLFRSSVVGTGFYWSENNAYLKPIWVKGRRAPKGLDPNLALIPRPSTGDATILSVDDVFKYKEEAPGSSADYSAPTFNDSAWPAGAGGFGNEPAGFGTPPANTVIFGGTIPTTAGNIVWIRKSLGALQREVLFLRVWADDGPEVWFNGEPITLTQVGLFEFTALIPASLVSPIGNNVIAYKVVDSFRFGVPFGNNTYIYAGAEITKFGAVDANPAHIIYECMTDSEWGMGSSSTLFNLPAWEASAQALFDEGLGLSLEWAKQTDIETFVREIIDHIEATLFVNPRTGLFELKLIRGDYDEEALRTLTPDNANLTKFQRKTWGETINEITVTWTNPENETEETVTVQDLGNISMQGAVVADSRNYYGVRTAALAQRLGWRDLRVAAAPLAACDVECDRSAWDLLPGDVVKVTWPEHQLTELVMRVGPVNYGKPGDSTIKTSLVEDVFAAPVYDSDQTPPPDSEWEDPAEVAAPMDYVRLFTLPYYFLELIFGAEDAAAIKYPEVFVGALAASAGGDTQSYELLIEKPDTLGNLVYAPMGTKNIVGRATLADDLPAEVESVIADFPGAIGPAPVAGGFAFIGDDVDAEMELCQLLDDGWTLRRGVLDTVPRAWPAGTPIWFFAVDFDLYDDETIFSAAQTVNAKLLTTTSEGQLDEADAPIVSAAASARPHLPIRPADVKVEGVAFDLVDGTADVGSIDVTWANRNRFQEAAPLLAWDAGTVTPEDGQTTKITVMDATDDSVIAVHDSLSGTSFALPLTSFDVGSPPTRVSLGIVRVTAERDGLESLQGHEILVAFESLPDGALLLSGDEQTGTDAVALSGDQQSGADVLQTSKIGA